MTAPPRTLQERPINHAHAEAKELALIKRDDSNLARCYLDASKLLTEAREALEKIAGNREYEPDDFQAAAKYKPDEGLWTMDEYLADVMAAKLKAASGEG